MRRISTLVFALAVVCALKTHAQTTCSTPTTSGTISNYHQVDASTLAINSGTTVTYNSPISYYNSTPPSAIPFYLTLQKLQTGGNSNFTASVTIKWGTGGSQNFTCATSSTVGGPSDAGTTYYFSISPSTPLPAGTNFQISVAIHNQGNKDAQIVAYGIDKNAITPAGAALPVKFSSFDAKPSANSVSLIWNVDAEENVSGYAVQKSSDGRNFSDIGFVNASGSNSYSYLDTKAGAAAYYRIKSVDVDGKYSFSTVVLVKGASAAIVLKAFPTPAVKDITIQHTTATANSLLTISAEDGRVVKSIIPSKGAQQTVVDLSSEKTGLYLIRYVDGNGQVETLKILKQ